VAVAAGGAGLPLFAAAQAGSISRNLLGGRLGLVQVDLPARKPALRAQWWKAALHDRKIRHLPDLPARLGMAIRLGPNRIADVVSAAACADDLVPLARSRVASDLPSMARLVRPDWTWDDLVLPARQREQLQRLCAVLEHAPRVMGDWGFSAKSPAGHNTIALFSGPSGTGKTMAASLIAASVGLHLYACNVASIFDKYVGETEKNLDRLFNETERANAILLFDEADVLFGVRTEVKDGHDRYGNLSVGYLLQRVESYDGLVILASNLASNMDEAFCRRLSHVVLFPMPDAALRRELWMRAFPRDAPLEPDIDMDALARGFELSGGNIRNAALAAAYLAAADGGPIARRHVLQAIASELEKMGRRPISADFSGFADEAGLAVGA
jgi:AAA+ superfamily predicted ATPase